ncbi:hypothetical protein JVX91_26055 [Pseudomonas sp. PDNC002]|uniref:hypothetical protein n=1 Tax=Pseudomonas sp. PDNC002 TaxID=2811422 RepID=UPI00196559A3|nr:hypothetical protein [Pseudomonas sp. PDNC002]QRY78996.1 hypothetical protein JVX91_26055 [Pseudomonas sp. PDNC002]
MPETPVTFSAWKLILSIAAGIWFGCLAVAVTLWLIWHAAPPFLTARPAPSTEATPATSTPPHSNEEMFQQYLQRQQAAQERQNREIEKAEQDKRFNSAPCQFWLQQYQADPTQKNREKMDGYCG